LFQGVARDINDSYVRRSYFARRLFYEVPHAVVIPPRRPAVATPEDLTGARSLERLDKGTQWQV